MLEPCRATLCWNWRDQTSTTSRYPEALSIGMIPFVWRQYDINNTYRIDDFQRVSSSEEFVEKALQLRNKDFFETKLEEFKDNYKKALVSESQYFKLFSKKLNFGLDLL